MAAYKKTAVVLLLFLALSSAGFSQRRNISVTLVVGGELVMSETFSENKGYMNSAEKIFGVNYERRAKRLKGEGKTDKAILETLFCGLTEKIEGVAATFNRTPIAAAAEFFPDKKEKFVYYEESSGREMDTAKIYSHIIENVKYKNVTAYGTFVEVKPKLTRAELIENTVFRGTFNTYYGSSGEPRRRNIERAVRSVNGTAVSSEAVFSFNATVGARTAERGYMEAPIIVDGKFEGGVGGGVCQVSTTLYNAVLYSDLPVLTVSRHSLPVRYVAPSFDAMVSSVSDFRFVNDTGYTLYIAAKCENGRVGFTLYGAPRQYDVTLVSEKIRDIPRNTEYIDDKNTDLGMQTVIYEGIDGIESVGYLVRSLNGREIARKQIRHDVYKPAKKVVSRGVRQPEITDIH